MKLPEDGHGQLAPIAPLESKGDTILARAEILEIGAAKSTDGDTTKTGSD
jgi:hypothetical protein